MNNGVRVRCRIFGLTLTLAIALPVVVASAAVKSRASFAHCPDAVAVFV